MYHVYVGLCLIHIICTIIITLHSFRERKKRNPTMSIVNGKLIFLDMTFWLLDISYLHAVEEGNRTFVP